MTRGRLFLRTWANVVTSSCTGAAAMVVAVSVLAALPTGGGGLAGLLLVPFAGVAGALFGMVYGLPVGLAGSWFLHPYPGRWTVRAFSRSVGLLAGLVVDVVPVCVLAVEGELDFGGWMWVWLVPAPVAGWWQGRPLMQWYIDESESARSGRHAVAAPPAWPSPARRDEVRIHACRP